jgi:hypothetical protein
MLEQIPCTINLLSPKTPPMSTGLIVFRHLEPKGKEEEGEGEEGGEEGEGSLTSTHCSEIMILKRRETGVG